MTSKRDTLLTHRIFGLDLMRATAIMMVLCAHVLWLFPRADHFLFQLLTLLGFFGVEMFFVLSGFLIGRLLYDLYLKPEFSPAIALQFLKRRWFRTLPNYYLILLLNVGIAAWIGYEVQGLWRYFVFMQNFAWPMMNFFPESWTLSIEETTYLLLPTTLLLFGFSPVKHRAWFYLFSVLALIFLCIFSKLLYHYNHSTTTMQAWNLELKAVVIYRIDAILFGALFAWFNKCCNSSWAKFRFIFVAIGSLLLVFLSFGLAFYGWSADKAPFFWHVLYLPIASMAFACFLPLLSSWQMAASWVTYPVTWLAIISYSVYLVHYGVVLQIMKVYCTPNFLAAHTTMVVSLYFLLTLGLGYFLYRWYEKPLTDLRDKY